MKKQLFAVLMLANILVLQAQDHTITRPTNPPPPPPPIPGLEDESEIGAVWYIVMRRSPLINEDQSDSNSRFRQYARSLNSQERVSHRYTSSIISNTGARRFFFGLRQHVLEELQSRLERPGESNRPYGAVYASENAFLHASSVYPRRAILVFRNGRHIHTALLVLPSTAAQRRRFGIQMGIFLHDNNEGSLQDRIETDQILRGMQQEQRGRNTSYNQFFNGLIAGWTGTWGGHRFPNRNLPQYTPAPRRRNGNNTNDGDGKVTAINIRDAKHFDQYVVYNLNGQLVLSTTDADFANHLSPGTYVVASKQGLQKSMKTVR